MKPKPVDNSLRPFVRNRPARFPSGGWSYARVGREIQRGFDYNTYEQTSKDVNTIENVFKRFDKAMRRLIRAVKGCFHATVSL